MTTCNNKCKSSCITDIFSLYLNLKDDLFVIQLYD